MASPNQGNRIHGKNLFKLNMKPELKFGKRKGGVGGGEGGGIT